MTEQPTPPPAAEPTCVRCNKTTSQHVGFRFCYAYTREMSRDDALAAFTPAPSGQETECICEGGRLRVTGLICCPTHLAATGRAGTGPSTNYVQAVPGTRVPFASGEPFQLYPSHRPESITLDVAADGRITIAPDATVDELRAALTALAHAFNRVRALTAADADAAYAPNAAYADRRHGGRA